MNDELAHLYEEDLQVHTLGLMAGTEAYRQMRIRDRQRRERTRELITAGDVESPEDFFHAARIFQHGDLSEDAWEAHQLAVRAAQAGYRPARLLAAAAYDRWLMYQGKPQKYGTNYFSDGLHQHLWDVDPSTSDAERAEWDVPPLAEQHQKAEEATRLHPPIPVPPDPPAWLQEAIRRKRFEEGEEYDKRDGSTNHTP
jgi:hypothetical protein